MNKIVSICCFLCVSNLAVAQFWFLGQQSKERYEAAKYVPYASLNLGAGSSTYVGELLPGSAVIPYGIFSTRWNFGVQYEKHFSRHFSYKASLSLIRIAGDDNYYNYGPNDGSKPFAANYARNLHFRNDLKELSFVGVFDIKAQTPFRKKRPQFSPYVFLGVAGIMSNPQARGSVGSDGVQKSWQDLRNISGNSPSTSGTENTTYTPFTFAVPVGIGFRYKLDQNTDVGFEFSYRQSFSDYLDDVSDKRSSLASAVFNEFTNRSGEFVAANTLKKVERLSPTVDLVNSPGFDAYFTTQVQLIFHIGRSAGKIN